MSTLTAIRSSAGLTVATALVIVAAIGGFVALTITHADTSAYLTVVGPVLTGLIGVSISGKVDAATSAQNAQFLPQLAQITSQTNGTLDKRITDGVRLVLTELGVVGMGPAPVGSTPPDTTSTAPSTTTSAAPGGASA